MRPRAWWRAGLATVVLSAVVVVASAGPGAAQPASGFTAEPLTPTGRMDVAKASTSRLVQTDPALLGRTDTTPVPVLIKLDHDPVATYAGEVRGLAATSPAVTGHDLSGGGAERRYESYLARREASFVGDLARTVPGATVGQRLRTVYGGVAAVVPANRVADVLEIDGVVAVQEDELLEPLTDSSPAFLGAATLYPQLGGNADAGRGVMIGVLDTGAWPEHPSFADQGNLDPPPGPARACEFGDNPLTPEDDPFVCNNKLVGGAAFLDGYSAVVGDEPFAGTARDGDGHGTHTASTAAGDALDSAPVFGVDRGPLNGIAPGAWVSVYRVCGPQGCFSSDSAAAVAQAILDGVDVVNFSISGGTDPFTDPVERVFLDAAQAGVFVAASAGNEGPGAGTVNHVSPWVTTVAASTQTRGFSSTLTLTADDGDTLELRGASITAGVTTDTPVVMSSAAPYGNALCDAPAAPGTFDGVIVACERGVTARVEKGYNVLQGGAVGMILHNPSLADVETDNHWLPTVHLADGTEFVGFMGDHTGVVATFTAGETGDGQGDAMAAFSSRGPGGLFLKPDVTAPGVQILAGNTPLPTPGDPADGSGPPGELFQAIAGTSMSSPHVAGAALLLTAQHPDWSPLQIKSALMTTATTDAVKEDLTTPADPLDFGSGRIDLTVAGAAGLTLDETAANMVALGGSDVTAVHLNLPSVNAPVMPGKVTTTRSVTNVTDRSQTYRVRVTSPEQSRITVRPSRFTVKAGRTKKLTVTITSSAPTGQLFGEIRLVPTRSGLPTQHLPVAFVPQQGRVSLASTCEPDSVALFGTSTCTVTATNLSYGDTTADLKTRTDRRLLVTGADGARVRNPSTVEKKGVEFAGAVPATPSLSPGTNPAGGWLPLSLFTGPTPIGDESILNFDVPEFVYGAETYTSVGATSNGYLVLGGGSGQDVVYEPPGIPDPALPNNVLAPFWTDLDGSSAPGVRAVVLGDGVNSWVVFEWELNPWGTVDNEQVFQVWIGLDGVEDVSFAYDPDALPTTPHTLVVGAEDIIGSAGDSLGLDVAPTEDLVVTTSAPVPGSSYEYTVTVRGILPGTGTVTSTMVSPVVPGTTVVKSAVTVTFPWRGGSRFQ